MPSLFTPEQRARIHNAYFDAMSDPVWQPPASLDAWERRAHVVRRELARVLGLAPLPHRPPLRVQVTGEIEADDYTVTRLYWQSFEGFYAGGWLYKPKRLREPAPAVLNPHGHWSNGARHPVVQSRLIGLAKRGYAALAVDSVHVTDFASGLCSMTAMTWNNIRAIDLLCAMDDVDTSRIGCTGASGGGQQTMYVAALDARITATVNVALVTWFKKILFPTEQTHCYCNHVPGLLAVTDEPEIVATIAPKPSLYLCVTGDWTRHFPQDEFPQIAHVYGLYGARDRTDVAQWDWEHDYHRPMRERMYAWFDRCLRGVGDGAHATEPEIETRTPEELDALSAPVAGARPWDELPDYYRSTLAPSRPDPSHLRSLLGADKRRVWLEADLFTRRNGASWVARGASGVPIPLTVHSSVSGDGARILILLHPDGKDAAAETDVRALIGRGWTVVAPDVRWRGEFQIRWNLNATVWGRPEVGSAADDVIALIDEFQSRRPELVEIAVVGVGDLGVAALAAAALDRRIRTVIAPSLGLRYTDGRIDSPLPNVLRYGDLEDLVRLCAGKRILIGGVGADGALYERIGATVLSADPPNAWIDALA